MLKTVFKRAGIGFLLAIALGNLISVIAGDGTMAASDLIEKVGSLRTAVLLQTLLSGLYGALCMGGTVLYKLERLPLLVSTAVHCAVCVVPYFCLSLLLFWTDSAVKALIMSGVQLGLFFVIWLIIDIRYKKATRELNRIRASREENKPEVQQ